MDKTPTSERSSVKTIPATVPFQELSFSATETEESRTFHDLDRLNYSEEIVNPIKVPIIFSHGSGYAGTFPSSPDQSLWPGPRGGAFIWLSCSVKDEGGGYMQSKQNVKLHRLELLIPSQLQEISEEERSIALYSCREIELQSSNPAFSFVKKLFNNPRSAIIHPIGTISGLESKKCSNLGLLVDFPFGVLGGRDPRPVIWNSLLGKAHEFDPKSLKSRGNDINLLKEGGKMVSKEPIYDSVLRNNLILQRIDGIGSDRRYSQYRLISLIPSTPRIATFMAPRSLSLNLIGSCVDWIVCSALLSERRLFYFINRKEGRLAAVYQTCSSEIKSFIRMRSLSNTNNTIELISLMKNGSLRRHLFPMIQVEMAKFDGAAGLLTSFPVCEFDTVSDGPYDQIQTTCDGFLARHGSLIMKLNTKYTVEQSKLLSPQKLNDFSLFQMTREGQSCISIIGTDPYVGRVTMNLIDASDLSTISTINLGIHEGSSSSFIISPSIYIPSRC